MAILTIGLSCLDQFFYLDKLPAENHKAYATGMLESGGGPCGNASYLLGKWNQPVIHVCTLGTDLVADKILAELTSVGVDCSYCLRDDNYVSPISAILINNNNGSRTIVTHKDFNPRQLTPTEKLHLDELIAKLNASEQMVYVLVDGHEYEASEYIIPRLQRKLVIMDAGNPKPALTALSKYTNYLVSSEQYAKALLYLAESEANSEIGSEAKVEAEAKAKVEAETKEDKSAEISEIHRALLLLKQQSHPEFNTPVITLGENGVVYLDRQDQMVHVQPYKCTPVDTTGAGDTFHGAFVYGISQGWDLEQILKFSSLTAVMMIEHQGVRNALPQVQAVAENLQAGKRNPPRQIETPIKFAD